MSSLSQSVHYRQYRSGKWEARDSGILVEAPVSLTVNGDVWLTFMCTPVLLEALAVGFLYNEKVIENFDEVADARVCEHGDNVDIWLRRTVAQPAHWLRTSGCTGGVTSVASFDDPRPGARATNVKLAPEAICRMTEMLLDSQHIYRETGGVHTSVLSDGKSILAAAEDIGRHNTLDKIAGQVLMEQIACDPMILITTGRISSEMLQKASRLGADVLISRTTPSSLSVEMAERWGMTLIGYARRNTFTIYTHPERIRSE